MKELEDFSWFPSALRLQQLEFIGWFSKEARIFKNLEKPFKNWLPEGRIRDLCSGSGQAAAYFSNWMGPEQYMELSDLYPSYIETYQKLSLPPNIKINYEALDVLKNQNNWIEEASGFTMFNAFHHFNEAQQRQLVQCMVQSNKPFFFVELLRPSLWTFIQVLITTTIGQVIFTPFIRPFRWQRFVLLPVNILTVLIDGLISVLKSKNAEQYHREIEGIDLGSYEINIFEVSSIFRTQLCVIEGKVKS